MAYRLRANDSPVSEGIRRIAREQLAKAIAAIDDPTDPEEAVHDIRTCCKKLRGLLRLIRPEIDEYRSENEALRDTARRLSGVREAKVLQDTYDLLLDTCDATLDRRTLGQIRRRFTLERKAELQRIDLAGRLSECRQELVEARDRASGWTIASDGWSGLAGGLAKTYARARSSAEEARLQGTPAAYHELRKQLKYHLFHTLLLRSIWPREMSERAAVATRASDLLGDYHDIAVLEAQLTSGHRTFGDRSAIEAALALAAERRGKLTHDAWPLIGRLLAEKTGALVDRWSALWVNWRGT